MSTIAAEDIHQKIEAANQEAFRRLVSADPVLVDVAPAGEVIPGLQDGMILHSGPPVEWEQMCGALRGSAICVVLFEGWAKTPDKAARMLNSGVIKFDPNHHHRAVGPMCGTTTPSLPVYVVENKSYGNRAYCMAEERHQFGDFSKDALDTLTRWRDVWAPALLQGIRYVGGIELKPVLAQALQMGDELHARPIAGSSLFAKAMAARMAGAGVPKHDLVSTLRYIADNEFLFLPISMASAKSAADPAAHVEFSTVVTAMARNGTEFGIRVSGLGDEWFTAPAPRAKGLFFPGYSEKDAGLDIGDSTITETVGWGAFTLAGATGILSLIGGTPEEATRNTNDMYRITVGTSPDYRIPALGFAGAPVGIDIRKVVETGIVPVLDTAIAHKDPGHPSIGTGMVRAPMDCFRKALAAFKKKYEPDRL